MQDTIQCQAQAGRGNPYYFYTFQTRTAQFAGTGDLVGAVFPNLARLAVIDLQQDVGLIGLVLSTSILNQTPGDTCAFAIGLDIGPFASLNGGVNFFLSHLTRQNSTAAIRSANAKTNAMQMGQNTAYLLNSGQKLALYGCSANQVGNELTGAVTASWIPYLPQSGG